MSLFATETCGKFVRLSLHAIPALLHPNIEVMLQVFTIVWLKLLLCGMLTHCRTKDRPPYWPCLFCFCYHYVLKPPITRLTTRGHVCVEMQRQRMCSTAKRQEVLASVSSIIDFCWNEASPPMAQLQVIIC